MHYIEIITINYQLVTVCFCLISFFLSDELCMSYTPVVITTNIILRSNNIQNADIPVPAYCSCHEKWPLKQVS